MLPKYTQNLVVDLLSSRSLPQSTFEYPINPKLPDLVNERPNSIVSLRYLKILLITF